MHSIACFFGLLFLVIFALIAIPILILVAKLIGLAFIGGAIALIVLGIWKLFDLAESQYRPYWSHVRSLRSAPDEVPAPCSSAWSRGDPVTLAVAVALQAVVTVAASVVPSIRAANVNPIDALRAE